MLYRRFGKTELQLPVISLGGMRFPKVWEEPHDVLPDETLQNAIEISRYAFSLGINHFETARGYGKSERLYGLVFKHLGLKRKDFMVTTKIGATDTADQMKSQIEDSLKFLQIDYIDNFDIHGINDRDGLANVLKKGGCLEAVRAAQKEGLIRHVGFSTHGTCEFICEAINTDEFESVNLHYYYFSQGNRTAVELAGHKDMGVFIISPTEKGGLLWAAPPVLKNACEPLSAVEMNDRWLLSHPQVTTLSAGATLPQHLDQHLGALVPGPLPNVIDRKIFAKLENVKAEIPDFCTECHECLPCPESIRIPEVLRMRNMAVGFGMTEFGRMRYNQMRKDDRWYWGSFGDTCTDCGDCLPRCPVELPIPKLLRETHAMLWKQPKQNG